MQIVHTCRTIERLKPLLKMKASNGLVEDRLLALALVKHIRFCATNHNRAATSTEVCASTQLMQDESKSTMSKGTIKFCFHCLLLKIGKEMSPCPRSLHHT